MTRTNMRILITGGGGFIGAWIIRRLLARGCEPRVLNRSASRRLAREIVGPAAGELDWRVGDVRDPAAVSSAVEGCDAVIHLAALLTPACRADPIQGAQVNLIGTLNVFEAAKRHAVDGVVYSSSAGVYGPDDGETPFPLTHYGAFKLACEASARAYWHDDGLASVGFRPLVVYGPGRTSGLAAGPTLACRAAVAGVPYVIAFTGRADFIYVDDVAAAFEAAVLNLPAGAHVFNLHGEVASVDDVISEIRRRQPGAMLSAEGVPLPIAPQIAADDLARVLPALPRTTLVDGVGATIDHYCSASRSGQTTHPTRPSGHASARSGAVHE